MSSKNVTKLFSAMLSVSMAVSMSMPAFASGNTVTTTAPIYSFDVTDVVVPTNFAVAFNPLGLNIKRDISDAGSTDKVVSRNYGIANKSSKAKLVTVDLTVTDKNEDGRITFATDESAVTNAVENDYVIHLTAVPADTNEVQVGNPAAPADKDVDATKMGNVKMTGAMSAAVPLGEGANRIGFKLEKAAYSQKDGSDIVIGSVSGNAVGNKMEITSLAESGGGVTAFTFGGNMNTNTDWSQISKGIEIKAVYNFGTAPETVDKISGTGAMVDLSNLETAPAFSTGTEVGVIDYSAGSGDAGLSSITKIEMSMPDGEEFDGYNAVSGSWDSATTSAGSITFQSRFINFFADAFPSDTVRRATVTYISNGGETKTATVGVKIR